MSEPLSSTTDTDIDRATLHRHAHHLGHHYRIEGDSRRALLSGNFGVERFRDGLTLRHAAIHNRQTMCNRAEMTPGLKIILMLSGPPEVHFGTRRLPFESQRPTALLVNLAEAEPFERQARANTRERSLTLTLSPQWMASQDIERDFMQRPAHLEPIAWQPSQALLSLADGLLDGPSYPEDWSNRLQREGLALTMAGEGLRALHGGGRPSPSGRQADRLWAFVDSGKADRLELGEISATLGMSISTLQRLCQARFGRSLQKHLRIRRLRAAEQALRQGASVNIAAELAGYSDPANFATAFRRCFGLTPTQARHAR
ncbi:helix-turn-helix transcriptional regulator [Salinicola avicenniae]|uniref:helix-turn-helix transcriptional regulator n=1 Tax=Salinicola avicenniae TaxID=2916836 RepID=UPI002072D15C|nr:MULTISPECIES: AraC family transcriptional regulator [unclassified Salinicola]